MKLSRNFTLRELTRSGTAERLGIDNTPTEAIIENLRLVAVHILQPVRDHFGIAFAPNSGYRCEALERAICWGGDNIKSSFARWCGRKGYPVDEMHWQMYFSKKQHPKGYSVDYEIPGVANYDLAVWVRDNLDFDKLILEFYKSGVPTSGWVHTSYTGRNHRKEVLTIGSGGMQRGLIQ